MDLSQHFLACLPAGTPAPPPTAELEARLHDMIAAGRAAWPALVISDEDFVAYAAERIVAGADVPHAIAKLHASDLYLACGCTRGDEAALAAFERHFMVRLAAHLRRAEALSAFTDEVRQAVRVRLLVSEDGLVPRIASYRGQGPLAVWLRLTATRLAINLRKSDAREPDPDDGVDVERLRADDGDPELEFLKSHYREELRAAVEGALASLPTNDGNILRLHFFERLSAEAMGAMFGVSARTVHRWITDIRGRIVAETRRLLNERFSISQTQMDSLVGLVGSQLEISVRRILEK